MLLAALAWHSAALRAEYHRRLAAVPEDDYATLRLQGFSEVEVPAASILSVQIVAGPFGVRVHKPSQEFIRLRQQGQRLTVTAEFPKGWVLLQAADETPHVIISCPRLQRLEAGSRYRVADRWESDSTSAGGRISIQNLRQDSLSIRQSRGNDVLLQNSTLGRLRAVSGTSPGSAGMLYIEADNHIEAANLTIGGRNTLHLRCAIPRLRYYFADSTTANFGAGAAHSLRPVPPGRGQPR